MQNTGQSFFFKKFIETGGGAPPVSYVISSSLGSELTVWTGNTNNAITDFKYIASGYGVFMFARGNTYVRMSLIRNNSGTLSLASSIQLSNQGSANPSSNTGGHGFAISGSEIMAAVTHRDSTAYNGNKVTFKRITFSGTTISETSSSVYTVGSSIGGNSIAYLGDFSGSSWYSNTYLYDVNNSGTTRRVQNLILERKSNAALVVHDNTIISTNQVASEDFVNSNTDFLTSSYDSVNDIMTYYYLITVGGQSSSESYYYHIKRSITGSSANPVPSATIIASSSAWPAQGTVHYNIVSSTVTVPYLNLDNRVNIIQQGLSASLYNLYQQFGTSSASNPEDFSILSNRDTLIANNVNPQVFSFTGNSAWNTSFNKVSDSTGLSSSLLSWNIYSDNGNSDYITTKTYLVDQNTFEIYQTASSVIPTSYTTANGMAIIPTDPDWGVIVYAKPTTWYLYARPIKIDKV